MPCLQKNCVNIGQWILFCLKHLSPLVISPIIQKFKVCICAIIFGLIIFAISCLQDKFLYEVRQHETKVIGIIVGVMDAEEENFLVPCHWPIYCTEVSDGLQSSIKFHITKISFSDCPVSNKIITKVFGVIWWLVNDNGRY